MQPFTVRLIDLKPGESLHEWRSDGKFFEDFGNSEILGADIRVSARVRLHGVTADVDCEVDGSVTVACDRCLEELEIPVRLSFAESYVPEGAELDLSQDVYDYVCTSLPLKRVHPDGECNQAAVRFLNE